MPFDGRPEGRKRSLDERIGELIKKRRSLFDSLMTMPRTLENRIVREEAWKEMRGIERELDALSKVVA